ncbi:TetR/AcrR family transcriptional regulator [Streptomyces sp. DSM 41014]|uniref:TetR/AcrR family transcriptional regulator n=1 Tax=Streptomyces hintoniae TaxID=3075521 RepID=A0ABU2UL01_9ACTN|nr:TetR/AcrR family transcriptional regulator [Streptomyces sp. DSM 41014]MDT0473770.1 TetR/AcrR family transcriptional regulator [Streptomyces sp. DSM 41014]
MTEGFTRRTPSRRGEGLALRGEILTAAAAMLTESGREGDLSLRAVAREVGISAPSVYLHFKDRAELVAAVNRQAYERLVAELREARDRAGAAGPRAALRAMAQHYCRFAVDNPGLYRLMFGIERMPLSRDELPGHPLWLLHGAWTEAVSACRATPQDPPGTGPDATGAPDPGPSGPDPKGTDPTGPHPTGDRPTGDRPSGRLGPADDARVVRLLWFSLHGVVAMAVAMPFAADRQGLEEMADDLLDLALTK